MARPKTSVKTSKTATEKLDQLSPVENVTKVEAAIAEPHEVKVPVISAPVTLPTEPASQAPQSIPQVQLKFSDSLYQKLKYQAQDEGISIQEYVTELISEGVVLRAWEILEKKAAMRGSNGHSGHSSINNHQHGQSRGNNFNPNSNNNNGPRRNNFNQGGNGGRRNGGMNTQRYQSIMEDKASFLDYVRKQERQQGR